MKRREEELRKKVQLDPLDPQVLTLRSGLVFLLQVGG